VIGGFDRITQIADATGIPIEDVKAERSGDFRAASGTDLWEAEKL